LCSEPKWEHLRNFDGFHLSEVAFKPYPCARQLHAGVEALLRIVQQHSLQPGIIGEIELFLPVQNAAMMNRQSITPTHAATVGSGQYVMAVTLLRGKLDLVSFEEEFLHDNRVRELMNKVKVSAGADLERHYPKSWPGRVVVRLIDGAIHSEEVIIPKGESGNPMSAGELEEKFVSLAAPVLGDERALVIKRELQSLEIRESLTEFLAALTP
jgi:2-methylcitrate dehydratase PrpD